MVKYVCRQTSLSVIIACTYLQLIRNEYLQVLRSELSAKQVERWVRLISYQEVENILEFLQKNLEKSRKILKNLENSRKFKKILEKYRKILKILNKSRKVQKKSRIGTTRNALTYLFVDFICVLSADSLHRNKNITFPFDESEFDSIKCYQSIIVNQNFRSHTV